MIHRIVYRCSPNHPPHNVTVLAASSTAQFTGARLVIYHTVYRCVCAASSTTQCTGTHPRLAASLSVSQKASAMGSNPAGIPR